MHEDQAGSRTSRRPLEVYLRDHFAGSTAGLALVRRARRTSTGTDLHEVLAALEVEIDDDRRTLRDLMSRLAVTPSSFKSAVGAVAELVARLKGNGRLVRRSPMSPVVELEGLAAGIVTKRNLWHSLRAAVPAHQQLQADELDVLIDRATAQLERVQAAHDRAAAAALGGPPPAGVADRPAV